MHLIINNLDFNEMAAEKYWSFTASFRGNPREEARNMIFSGDYIGAEKKDGAYYRFCKSMDGEMTLQGRNKSVSGEYLNKIDWVPQLHDFFNSLPNGTCLLGEIYFPKQRGSNNVTKIMGCLKDKAIQRQNEGDKLHYYIFDILAWDGKSFMKMCAKDRFKFLMMEGMKRNKIKDQIVMSCIDWAEYLEGADLWSDIGEILARDGEGVVITKKNSYPEPGKRTARKTLKIKKELSETIDCFFTGRGTRPTKLYSGKELEHWSYWENQVTGEKINDTCYQQWREGAPLDPVTKPYFYGWVGSLEIAVMRDGKIFQIGFLSGLIDEIKSNPRKYKGRCIEVSAMEIFKNEDGSMGGLRHPKFIGFRDDLSMNDCTFDKIEN